MTLSDNWATPRSKGVAFDAIPAAAPLSSLDFVINREVSPAEAVEQSTLVAEMALPAFFEGRGNAAPLTANVVAVLTELVDVTARHKPDIDLVCRVSFDGQHVTVSVGDMGRTLPPPEEEPGLYLVHRIADQVGQYDGFHGGRVTWAAVAA